MESKYNNKDLIDLAIETNEILLKYKTNEKNEYMKNIINCIIFEVYNNYKNKIGLELLIAYTDEDFKIDNWENYLKRKNNELKKID